MKVEAFPRVTFASAGTWPERLSSVLWSALKRCSSFWNIRDKNRLKLQLWSFQTRVRFAQQPTALMLLCTRILNAISPQWPWIFNTMVLPLSSREVEYSAVWNVIWHSWHFLYLISKDRLFQHSGWVFHCKMGHHQIMVILNTFVYSLLYYSYDIELFQSPQLVFVHPSICFLLSTLYISDGWSLSKERFLNNPG